jgi:hypothetical protein
VRGKSQISNYKFQIMTKYQIPKEGIEDWRLEFIWVLVLGIWDFCA